MLRKDVTVRIMLIECWGRMLRTWSCWLNVEEGCYGPDHDDWMFGIDVSVQIMLIECWGRTLRTGSCWLNVDEECYGPDHVDWMLRKDDQIEYEFDSTGIFHWCPARAFTDVLVSRFWVVLLGAKSLFKLLCLSVLQLDSVLLFLSFC